MKVIESNGKSTRSAISSSDPFPRSSCSRLGCPLGRGSEGCQSKCYKTNLNYTYTCARCEQVLSQGGQGDQVQLPQYRGETSRTAFTRNKQHMASYKQMKEGFMWDHTLDKHGGTRSGGDGQVDYTMVVHRTDRDPMRRIVREAVRI